MLLRIATTLALLAAAAQAQTVTLQSTASPLNAKPGTTVSVTGTGFPTGTILPSQTEVILEPGVAALGTARIVNALSVVTVVGTTRRVSFQVPTDLTVASSVNYRVTVRGQTSTGVVFQSATASALIIDPASGLTSVTPASATQGQSLTVAIIGAGTNFVQGSTLANFGPGIATGGAAENAFGPVTVTSSTTATATIVINPAAVTGARTVTLRTGATDASLANGFTVNASIPAQPTVVTLSAATTPSTANPGTAVTVSGANFPTTQINPAAIQLKLEPAVANAGPTLTVPATSVNPATGAAARTIGFTVPTNITLPAATAYLVSLTGTTTTNLAFSSSNKSAITLAPLATAPKLLSVSPNSGPNGQSLAITITGQATAFTSQSTVNLGAGITVTSKTTTNATTITAQVTIAPDALTGARTLTVTTGSQVLVLSNAFTVNTGNDSTLTISITAPANLSYVNRSPITVNGTVSDNSATVAVNGISTPVADKKFSVSVPLIEGPNTLAAVAKTTTRSSATSVTATLDTTPPKLSIDSPLNNLSTTDPAITVRGLINDIVLGTVNGGEAEVFVNNLPAQVSNRSFLATNVPLNPGDNVIQVLGRDRAGNGASTTITVKRTTSTASRIAVFSGDNQTGPISTNLAQPITVILRDAAGQPVGNKPVVFSINTNDGLLTSPASTSRVVTATSGGDGKASVSWKLGARAGAGSNSVIATSPGFQGPATFTATGTAAAAAKILVDAGNNQTGVAGSPLKDPFVVVVADSGNNRLSNVPVTFSVGLGGGTIGTASTYTVPTDSDGRAQAVLSLGATEGPSNNTVLASIAANPALKVTFYATSLLPGDTANTRVTGVVLDNSNVPIAGVTMRLYARNASSQSAPWQLVSSALQTNAQGQFAFSNAPVGLVRLDVDGSTAQRPGTWAHLEFDFVTVSGRDNTVGAPIFLLPLDTASQLCVSPTTGGTLSPPSIPGFALTVAPDSVTFPGGSRSGCISVTKVNNDKVPMAPSFGIQPRLAVTIQPPGMRFDPPAPFQVPNLDALPAGQVVELFSFDHDLSQFVSIGPATVSPDGMVIRSNRGVGIVKGGWHLPAPPDPNGCVIKAESCSFPSGDCALESYQIDSLEALLELASSTGSAKEDGLERMAVSKTARDIYALGSEVVPLKANIKTNCKNVSYEWDFGDNSPKETTTQPKASHRFPDADKDGLSDPEKYTVTVKAICAGSDQTECTARASVIKVTIIKVELSSVRIASPQHTTDDNRVPIKGGASPLAGRATLNILPDGARPPLVAQLLSEDGKSPQSDGKAQFDDKSVSMEIDEPVLLTIEGLKNSSKAKALRLSVKLGQTEAAFTNFAVRTWPTAMRFENYACITGPGQGFTPGSLVVDVRFGSESGAAADLAQMYVGEVVNFPGDKSYYSYPSPPWVPIMTAPNPGFLPQDTSLSLAARSVPEKIDLTGTEVRITDEHFMGTFLSPVTKGDGFEATQRYQFRDPALHSIQQFVTFAGFSGIKITREVKLDTTTNSYVYVISKSKCTRDNQPCTCAPLVIGQ